MIDRQLTVLGIGRATPVFMEVAMDSGYTISSLYHYNGERTGEKVYGHTIEGSFDDLFCSDIKGRQFLLTMGDRKIRKELSEKILASGGIIPTIIHPTALISKFASISSTGVIIYPYCTVQADVELREGVMMETYGIIGHTSKVDAYAFIGPKALVGANTHIKEGAFIGQSSVLISNKAMEIGVMSTVGAGAVVTRPVDDYTTVIGNPARVMKNE